MFSKFGRFRNGCRRVKLVITGLIYLVLALVFGVSVIPFEDDSADSSLERLSALPNYNYLGEVEKLRETSLDEAKQLARYIFETEGMPDQDEARRIYEEIEKEQKSWWGRTWRATSGFVTGEGGSLEELGGSVASDMFLYGDVRDLIKHSYYKVTGNEKGDAFVLTLSGFGLATEVFDVVDWAPAVLKAFRKAGALSTKMVGLLSDGIKKCVKARKLDDGFKAVLSGIRSLTDTLGFARASSLMKHADDAADVAALVKAVKLAPDESYLFVKYSGKDGVRALETLTEEQVKVLRVAAKKGPDALKNIKKFGNEMKARTASARRLARLVKSIQSGHLTGFLHKLILAFHFLRYVFISLALICVLMSGWKLWQVTRT